MIGAQRLVIIGTGETAAIVFESFSWDSPHEVVAFSADRVYITSDTISERPVVPLDELATAYPPREFRVFVAVSMTGLNRVRRSLYDRVKSLGFECISYVSSSAVVNPSVRIGENVRINGNASLAYSARVGNNVVIGSGSHIGHSAVIEDDCFVSPHSTVCGFARIGRGAFLGAWQLHRRRPVSSGDLRGGRRSGNPSGYRCSASLPWQSSSPDWPRQSGDLPEEERR